MSTASGMSFGRAGCRTPCRPALGSNRQVILAVGICSEDAVPIRDEHFGQRLVATRDVPTNDGRTLGRTEQGPPPTLFAAINPRMSHILQLYTRARPPFCRFLFPSAKIIPKIYRASGENPYNTVS